MDPIQWNDIAILVPSLALAIQTGVALQMLKTHSGYHQKHFSDIEKHSDKITAHEVKINNLEERFR